MSVPHNESEMLRICYIDGSLFTRYRHKKYKYIFIRLKVFFAASQPSLGDLCLKY